MKYYGAALKIELDPRDQKICEPFYSEYYQKLLESNFTISLVPLENELRDWLVDVIEIVSSAGFNHLKK